MQNEKQVYRPQQKEEQNIDIKQMFFLFLNHWYLFFIFVVIALAICFLYNRYSTRVYQTSGTVLIKEGKGDYDPTSIMTTMNIGNSQNVDAF